MRFFYSLLTTLLTPLALVRLQRDERKPGRWRERLGRIPETTPGQIWVHAASVGEINAARTLIGRLLEREATLLVTTMTASGAQRCRELFGERVEHRYLPLDNPFATKAWLRRARPRAGLIVETEIWPGLYAHCQRLNLPLLLVSARISDVALKRYRRFSRLFGRALDSVAYATCQSRADADRLHQLGLSRSRMAVTGNLKFDIDLSPDISRLAAELRVRWGGRAGWTAGSTRPGEEEVLMEAHRRLQAEQPKALLVLAPRHPQRTNEIAQRLERSDLTWCRFGEPTEPMVDVILIDRLGLLMPCYAATEAAFVGASLVALGGHNLLEPALLGRPVLAGPHLNQQAEARTALEQSGGLIQVEDASELAAMLLALFQNPERAKRLGESARQAVESGRGSLARTLLALQPWLDRSAP